MKIGNREFDVKNRTYIMGILNVTPDSFSDGGKWNTMDHALMHAEAMIKDADYSQTLHAQTVHFR